MYAWFIWLLTFSPCQETSLRGFLAWFRGKKHEHQDIKEGNGVDSDGWILSATKPETWIFEFFEIDETSNWNPKPHQTPIWVIICSQNQTRRYPKPKWILETRFVWQHSKSNMDFL